MCKIRFVPCRRQRGVLQYFTPEGGKRPPLGLAIYVDSLLPVHIHNSYVAIICVYDNLKGHHTYHL